MFFKKTWIACIETESAINNMKFFRSSKYLLQGKTCSVELNIKTSFSKLSPLILTYELQNANMQTPWNFLFLKIMSQMLLDSKLYFKEHIQNVLNKVDKTIRLLRKLRKILPRPLLTTIVKSFIRPHLGYGDIIYNLLSITCYLQRFLSSENGVHSVQRRTSNNRSY